MFRILGILLFILVFFNHDSYSASVIGKISSTVNEEKQIYPFLTDEITRFRNDSVVSIRGGKFIVENGTVIKASESDGRVYFKIADGTITFKIFPEKTRITFQTPNGDIATPDIIPASVNTIEGELSVNKKETTILQVNQGSLDVITQTGSLNLFEGEGIVLAQADLDSETPKTGSSTTPASAVTARNTLPVEILSYLRLAGDKGVTTTPLTPTGRVKIEDIKNAGYNARVVDPNLETLPDQTLNENTNVKIVCSALDGKDPTLVVRKFDSYYPETVREKSLIGLEVDQVSESGFRDDYRRGIYDIVVSDENEMKRLSKFRSLENWQTEVIDPETLLPVGGESDYTDDKTKNSYSDDEGVDNKRVLCIKSTLLLQPVDQADSSFYGLVGKQVIAKDMINPSGKVLLDGQIYDGLIVDYNLQPIKGAEVAPGRTLEVVGVKKGSTILLLQFPGIVQEEIPNFVGKTVTGITEFDPYGVVTINGEDWLGIVVDSQFNPVTNSVASGTQFRVVSAQTILLIQSDPAILAAYYATPAGLAGATSSNVTTAVITTATVGGIIAGGIIIASTRDDDDGGDDGTDDDTDDGTDDDTDDDTTDDGTDDSDDVDPPISPINP